MADLLETVRVAYRERDAARLAGVYADDVECTIMNRNNPPSRPLVLRGRKAVLAMLADMFEREMTHEVTFTVVGTDAFAYRLHCRYPDGCNAIGHYLATVRDGLVVKEFSMDCWDE